MGPSGHLGSNPKTQSQRDSHMKIKATCVLLGKMQQAGRGTAESLLEGKAPWPEKNAAVLEARRKALSSLRGEVQDNDETDYGEEVEEWKKNNP